MKKLLALSVLALSTSACTSVSDVRGQAPSLSFITTKSPEVYSTCVYSAAVGITPDMTMRNTIISGVHHVTATMGTDKDKLPLYDVAVASIAQGSRVELRSPKDVWGGTLEPTELHQILRRCAMAEAK